MSATAVSETTEVAIAEAAHAVDPNFHLAHHFDTPQQQFAAGKLGIWLFLVTEVLFFSGLFGAYAVYRSIHPEVFQYAHQFLDKSLGALNTVVLICSSLTMAWAVRAAQLGQRRVLVSCLVITLACATFFLGVKAVEYSHKWEAGLLWGAYFSALSEHAEGHEGHAAYVQALRTLSWPAVVVIGIGVLFAIAGGVRKQRWLLGLGIFTAVIGAAFFGGMGVGHTVPLMLASGSEHAASHAAEAVEVSPRLLGIFFSIYFVMTGIHAIHILIGIGVIYWLLVGAVKGRYGPLSFGRVDYVGLYWHLVDLIWIYLFPLLYLIH